jgi:phosphoribosyl-AMP cyclohydrolase
MNHEDLALDFDKLNGLIPVVTQDTGSLEVLMVGFMNREAWEKTLATGYVHYFSRSRNCLWKKGETSGHLQKVHEIRVDCDQDAIVIRIEQVGGICCHTGRRSCFYRRYGDSELDLVDQS